MILEAGNRAYVSGMGDSKEPPWFVYRRGGAAGRPGEQDHARLRGDLSRRGARGTGPESRPSSRSTRSTQEVSVGDKLVPAGKPADPDLRAARAVRPIQGRIISLYGERSALAEDGQSAQLFRINRGRSQGIEVGTRARALPPGRHRERSDAIAATDVDKAGTTQAAQRALWAGVRVSRLRPDLLRAGHERSRNRSSHSGSCPESVATGPFSGGGIRSGQVAAAATLRAVSTA